jgi:DNA-binding XRE family transcriptional regulator
MKVGVRRETIVFLKNKYNLSINLALHFYLNKKRKLYEPP